MQITEYQIINFVKQSLIWLFPPFYLLYFYLAIAIKLVLNGNTHVTDRDNKLQRIIPFVLSGLRVEAGIEGLP